MKKEFKISILFFVILVQTICVFSQNEYKATLYFIDGTQKSGIASFVSSNSKNVIFREDQSSPEQEISSSSLKSISYQKGSRKLEFDYISAYSGIRQKRITGPYWFKVVKRGYATLYTIDVTMVTSNIVGEVKFVDYYIIRDGEQAAKLISSISSANNNSTFKTYAPKYFSDYPELAQKIKSKEYKYNDLEKVVDIYNEWIINNKD